MIKSRNRCFIPHRPACLLLFGACVALPARAAIIALKDVNGVLRTPLKAIGQRAIVLLFISHDCPISNGYAPEVNRIQAEYAPKKIAFYVVYTDSDASASVERRHAQEYGFRCPALCDPKHLLVKRTGATVTPEAVVLSPEGKTWYCGRIDDTYVTFGVRRMHPTQRDLRDALDAIVHGKLVVHPSTKAIGCFIPGQP